MVLFHLSPYKNFLLFYLYGIGHHYRACFGDLPHYDRFVSLMPLRLFAPLIVLLHSLSGAQTGVYFADATKRAVCHNRRIHRHKVFDRLAARGKTSIGEAGQRFQRRSRWNGQMRVVFRGSNGFDVKATLLVESDIADAKSLGLGEVGSTGIAAVAGDLARWLAVRGNLTLQHGQEPLGIGRIADFDDDVEDQATAPARQVDLVAILHVAAALDDDVGVRFEQADQFRWPAPLHRRTPGAWSGS